MFHEQWAFSRDCSGISVHPCPCRGVARRGPQPALLSSLASPMPADLPSQREHGADHGDLFGHSTELYVRLVSAAFISLVVYLTSRLFYQPT